MLGLSREKRLHEPQRNAGCSNFNASCSNFNVHGVYIFRIGAVCGMLNVSEST
jgi:hypothetical protein